MNSRTVENLQIISHEQLLEHWLGHRNLTRKVIELFPEEAFFNYSIGAMRSFADMTLELLAIAAPGIKEIATRKTTEFKERQNHNNSKELILSLWDKSTIEINEYWQQIPIERFQESIKSFGEYEGTVLSSIFYFIDNEIHHRAQAYVYLRSLGIEPPYFWLRD